MEFERWDRVIGTGTQTLLNIRGLTGTITSIHSWGSYDVTFDKPLPNGCKTWCCNANKIRIYQEDLEKRKENSLRNKDVDPFGEEIWENYSPFVFKKKDKVICKGIQDGVSIENCTGTITEVNNHNCKIRFDIPLANGVSGWYVEYEKIMPYDKIEYEERMKRRRENSLKNLDKDPFQEEIWESSKYKKFKVGDRVICRGKMSGINIEGSFGTILEVRNDGYYYVVKFDEIKPIAGNVWNIYGTQLELLENEEEHFKKRDEKKLKYKNIDPFGEEIWEHMKKFENYITEQKTNRFEIGDKVVGLGSYDGLPIHGKNATILKMHWSFSMSKFMYLVEFNKEIKGVKNFGVDEEHLIFADPETGIKRKEKIDLDISNSKENWWE